MCSGMNDGVARLCTYSIGHNVAFKGTKLPISGSPTWGFEHECFSDYEDLSDLKESDVVIINSFQYNECERVFLHTERGNFVCINGPVDGKDVEYCIKGYPYMKCGNWTAAVKIGKRVEKETEMKYKIDLSWIKGEAREVLGNAIQQKLFASNIKWADSSTDLVALGDCCYLYIADKKLKMGSTKVCFESSAHKEVSVNSVLSGKWKIIEEKLVEFKRGDHILVRDFKEDIWKESYFSFKLNNKYLTTSAAQWNFAIPFTEEKLGKV